MGNNNEEHSGPVSKWRSFFKSQRLLRIYRYIINSASFGLFLTLVIFVYEQYEQSIQTEKIVDNLVSVQNSLTTKYLGLFPDYLNRINEVLDNAQPKDTVVIFEDVLYYGFMSKPDEFKQMHRKLISLSEEGAHITIAYYNPDRNTFKKMVCDQYISINYLETMKAEINKRDRVQDSLIREKYFDKTRSDSPKNFNKNVDKYRRSFAKNSRRNSGQKTEPGAEFDILYRKIDSIKTAYLSKDYNKICLYDFLHMYRGITTLLADEFYRHGINMIPIDENFSMSCWLVADKAILAFPSKYSTDEIGFFSQDPAFSKYIHTMLMGLRGNYPLYKPGGRRSSKAVPVPVEEELSDTEFDEDEQ